MGGRRRGLKSFLCILPTSGFYFYFFLLLVGITVNYISNFSVLITFQRKTPDLII